jgi:hypothetical protein
VLVGLGWTFLLEGSGLGGERRTNAKWIQLACLASQRLRRSLVLSLNKTCISPRQAVSLVQEEGS